MAKVEAPSGAYPKYGSFVGWTPPRFKLYIFDTDLGRRQIEHLEFACVTCGYAAKVPCADVAKGDR